MADQTNGVQAKLSSYATYAMNYLSSPKKSFTSTTESFLSTLSSVMESASNLASRMLDNVQFLKNKAVHTVNTVRSTAHGSVDGALIGGAVGLFLWGPFGMGQGMWIGSVAGGVWGFTDAVNQDPYTFNATVLH